MKLFAQILFLGLNHLAALYLPLLGLAAMKGRCSPGRGIPVFFGLLLLEEIGLLLLSIFLSKRENRRLAILVGTIIAGFALFAGTNLLFATERGFQSKTYISLFAMADRVAWVRGHSRGVAVCEAPELTHLRGTIPCVDGWGRPFRVWFFEDRSYLVSFGACGEADVSSPDDYEYGPVERADQDLVVKNGLFLRYPGGRAPGRLDWDLRFPSGRSPEGWWREDPPVGKGRGDGEPDK